MRSTKQPPRLISTQVERVRRRLERRRCTRNKRTRIPEELWNEAVQVAGRYGVNKTARALRLNDYAGIPGTGYFNAQPGPAASVPWATRPAGGEADDPLVHR